MSFECRQTDGGRQYGPCHVRGVQPYRGALEHEHEVARQFVRTVSRILNANRPTFFDLYVGLHGPGWLYVLGWPPRRYLLIFATANPQSTCHGPRPGPTLAPW